jgi:arsenate reductase
LSTYFDNIGNIASWQGSTTVRTGRLPCVRKLDSTILEASNKKAGIKCRHSQHAGHQRCARFDNHSEVIDLNVLFLCTGNSCRSIISEATFNHLAPGGWQAISAGSQPTGKLNGRALALLAAKGISTEGYYSKSWEKLPAMPDIVVTVCGSAAGETCPAYLGPVLRTHWGVDDPSHVVGTEQEIDGAFETAYAILRARIDAFFALPLQDLAADQARFKAELDRIGTLAA